MNNLDEWTKRTARSQVSTFKCNHYNSTRSEALQSSHPVSVTNRFSVFAKLPDPTTRKEETPPEGRTIDGSNYNYKRKQNQKRQSVRNNANNYHGRTPVQHPTDCQIPRREPKNQGNGERKPNLTFENDCNNPQSSARTNLSVSDRLNSEIIPTRCKNCVYSSQWLYSTCFG